MKKILISDDSATIGKLLSVYLLEHFKQEGVEILKAQDGAEALFMLRDHPDIELVFLDIMMPIVDGYSVAQYIYSRKLQVDTIIISATLDKEMITSLGKIGFKNFLPKPIHNERLKPLLDRIATNKMIEDSHEKVTDS